MNRLAKRDRWPAAARTASETLPYDCLTGDALPFKPADNLEAGGTPLAAILGVGVARPTPDGADDLAGTGGLSEAEALRFDNGTRRPSATCRCHRD